MNLNEIFEVVKNVATVTGGTILKKEFLMTDKGSYLFLNTVDDTEALNEYLNESDLIPVIVSNRNLKYEVDDILEIETNVFNLLSQECLMVQGSYLYTVFNCKIVGMRLIAKDVL
jgi:type IV secretory pathway TrbF-like protein